MHTSGLQPSPAMQMPGYGPVQSDAACTADGIAISLFFKYSNGSTEKAVIGRNIIGRQKIVVKYVAVSSSILLVTNDHIYQTNNQKQVTNGKM